MTPKVDLSRMVIQKAFSEHDPRKCAVACSFGKDSMAVLHMIRQVQPNILVVYENTGVEYPQTLRFRDRMVKEWDLNFIEARSKDWTFWKCVKKYGFPNSVRSNQKGGHNPQCCAKLKEDPAMAVFVDHGTELVFTGLTAAESHNRKLFFMRCGEYYFAKTTNLWKCHPIASWTANEVLAYHRDLDIPLNPLYEEFPGVRVGCMPCTGYRFWPEVMAKTTPKMYRHIQKMRGQELID